MKRKKTCTSEYVHCENCLYTSVSKLFLQGHVNPFVLSYVYICTKSQNRCDSCTYTYTEFAIEIWGFNRHLTDILRYHQQKVFMCFRLLAAITSACLPVGRKVEFTRSSPLFVSSFESYDCRTKFKFIDWHGKQR